MEVDVADDTELPLVYELIPNCAVAKFGRAQKHFKELRAEVKALTDPHAYRLRSEANSDFTEHRFYIDFATPVPGAAWGLIFGDGVQCLRSALDHTVYAIGVKEARIDPPPKWRSLQFPLTADSGAFAKSQWHISSLSGPAQAAIERLQPHGNPAEFFLRPLGTLEEFNNADKHRAIHVVASFVGEFETLISGLIPGTEYTRNFRVGALEEDTPFLTVTSGVSTPDMKVDDDITFEIGLQWIRASGVETLLPLWEAVDLMNKAVAHTLTSLLAFL